jgi:hypothetical protein
LRELKEVQEIERANLLPEWRRSEGASCIVERWTTVAASQAHPTWVKSSRALQARRAVAEVAFVVRLGVIMSHVEISLPSEIPELSSKRSYPIYRCRTAPARTHQEPPARIAGGVEGNSALDCGRGTTIAEVKRDDVRLLPRQSP